MKIRALLIALTIVGANFLPASASAATLTIGIAYDMGGRGDRSFNDAAALGLEKARKEFSFEIQASVTDGTTSDRERRVRSLIEKGCNPIILVGNGYAPTIEALAVEFPNTQFAILNDASIPALNVTSLIFSDNQGAYLAGYSAALVSRSKKVAMIANRDQADMYQSGFAAGVSAAKLGVKALVRYVNGSSIATAKEAMATGADVLFIARPGSNSEVFAQMVSRNRANASNKGYREVGMITIEPDQYLTVSSSTRKYLYATVVKRVDKAMYDTIAKAISGGQALDFIDAKKGIYGQRYTVTGGGITFTTYLPALTAASASINRAAANAAKIIG